MNHQSLVGVNTHTLTLIKEKGLFVDAENLNLLNKFKIKVSRLA